MHTVFITSGKETSPNISSPRVNQSASGRPLLDLGVSVRPPNQAFLVMCK